MERIISGILRYINGAPLSKLIGIGALVLFVSTGVTVSVLKAFDMDNVQVANVQPEPKAAPLQNKADEASEPITEPTPKTPSKLKSYASRIADCEPFEMTYTDTYGVKQKRAILGIVPEFNSCAFEEELPHDGLMTCWIVSQQQYDEVTSYYRALGDESNESESPFNAYIMNGTCEVTGY